MRTLLPRPVVLTLILAILVGGCANKNPQTPPRAAAASTPPGAVTPDPRPSASSIPDPWAGDLDAINELARQQGRLGPVYFDFDRYDLRPEARQRLAENARFLFEQPDMVVLIEGHCDEWGTHDYNLALGDRRAHAARGYLLSLGVPESRIRTITYGKEQPFCRDATPDCWAENRRGHFVIVARDARG